MRASSEVLRRLNAAVETIVDAKGYTQKQMAEKVGRPPNTISRCRVENRLFGYGLCIDFLAAHGYHVRIEKVNDGGSA